MTLGLRALLLLVALILFVVAAIDDNGDWIPWGLALLTAAFLVGEAGWDRRFGTGSGAPRG